MDQLLRARLGLEGAAFGAFLLFFAGEDGASFPPFPPFPPLPFPPFREAFALGTGRA